MCCFFETNLQPSEHQIDKNHLNQLFEKLEQIIDNDLLYDVRRSAELCLFAIRERHCSKVKETMKNEQDFDNYVKIKKQIRTEIFLDIIFGDDHIRQFFILMICKEYLRLVFLLHILFFILKELFLKHHAFIK